MAILVASCSGERPVLLTEAGTVTSATTAAQTTTTAAEAALTEADCVTASGAGPWQLSIDATPTPAVRCLLIAAHQRVEFVNNTPDAVSFDLAGLSVLIEPTTTFLTEPAGTFLQPGLTDLNATPHPVSGLWSVDPSQRALNGQSLGLSSFGPVEIGAAPISLEGSLEGRSLPTSDAACYVTSLAGDPYSPVLTVVDGTVAVIQVFSAGQLTRSEIGVGASEGDVLAAYGQQIESLPAPNADTNTKLLVFVPADEADKRYRLVFVVENGMVVSLRTGLTDLVLNNPGCG
ncbi:MAG: hypothetical protein ACRBK7_13990 [Acidimicrobiales bacterium]